MTTDQETILATGSFRMYHYSSIWSSHKVSLVLVEHQLHKTRSDGANQHRCHSGEHSVEARPSTLPNDLKLSLSLLNFILKPSNTSGRHLDSEIHVSAKSLVFAPLTPMHDHPSRSELPLWAYLSDLMAIANYADAGLLESSITIFHVNLLKAWFTIYGAGCPVAWAPIAISQCFDSSISEPECWRKFYC